MSSADVDQVWDDWSQAVNMTASELEKWLGSDQSRSVGDRGSGGESTGHQSGKHIIAILRSKKAELSKADVSHMRKVVGYVHRHQAQRRPVM